MIVLFTPQPWLYFRTLHAESIAQTSRQLEREIAEPETFRRRHVSLLDHSDRRQEVEKDSDGNTFEKAKTCDQSLLLCLPNEECAGCFRYLYNENIDWGTVTPDTSCTDVVDYLGKKNYCSDLKGDQHAVDLFCQVCWMYLRYMKLVHNTELIWLDVDEFLTYFFHFFHPGSKLREIQIKWIAMY